MKIIFRNELCSVLLTNQPELATGDELKYRTKNLKFAKIEILHHNYWLVLKSDLLIVIIKITPTPPYYFIIYTDRFGADE